MREGSIRGLTVSVIATVVFIAILEVSLRIFGPTPDPDEKLKAKRSGLIEYEYPVHLKLRTVSKAGSGGQKTKMFTTNNLGFRGDPLSLPKRAGEFRVFMVGGSTMEGFYLDDSDAIHSVVQKELERNAPRGLNVKVYNTGKSGDRSYDHVALIVHRLVHLQPDMIVVFCGVNDLSAAIFGQDYLHRASKEKLTLLNLVRLTAFEFEIPKRLWYLSQRFLPRTKRERRVLEDVPLTSNHDEKVKLAQSFAVSNRRPRTDLTPYRKNLETIAGVARAHGVQLVLMTQASSWNSRVDPEIRKTHWMVYRKGVRYRDDFMDGALEAYNNVMRQVAAGYSIPLYDIARLIPKSREYFNDDVHFTVKGARIAGLELASLIFRKGLLFPQGRRRADRAAL
jgi:lysophospholipase L1-like esterase